MDELQFIEAGLRTAAAQEDEGFSVGQIHRNRSRNFVEAVAAEFRAAHSGNPKARVLSKHCSDYRAEFGLNELLYDTLVCEIDVVSSPRHATRLAYVSRALWQIESELAADGREALFDFNKLVLGSASKKLFIGPTTDDDPAFLGALLPAALCCSGEVYAALVPHPSTWKERPLSVTLWRTKNDDWDPLSSP